ncbi:MAG: adaptor protein MecA [Lachnospiraceae bacterium]|nr:adaptor protein MecA [Lachnospiraceae bacterium]
MEFRKIDNNSFECKLTKEDLEEFDISLEDFMKNREKVSEFLHKLVEIGGDEIDFEPEEGGVMTMQISPLPNDGLRLVLSNKLVPDTNDLVNMLKQIVGATAEISGAENIAGHMAAGAGNKSNPDAYMAEVDKLFSELSDDNKGDKKSQNKKFKTSDGFNKPRMYSFGSFKAVEEFVSNINVENTFKSKLMYESASGVYYLVVERGRLDKLAYARLCEGLLEYGEYVTDKPAKISLITEHSKVIFATQAVKALREI